MKYELNNLEGLEHRGKEPATDKDCEIIESYLEKEIELYYDDQLRVWTPSGKYIANLKKREGDVV